MVTILLLLVWCIVAGQRLHELALSAKHVRAAIARGGREVGKEHYWMVLGIHAAWMIGWPIETYLRGMRLSAVWPVLTASLVSAEALRLWAMASLGERWTTRVVTVPGGSLVKQGPYRYCRHPNYLAVQMLLILLPSVFRAYWTAGTAAVLNAIWLLALRVPAENSALGMHDIEER